MARPIKNNAEYFSHDADMRNDLRIKALRRKFGHTGYAVWCFLLETMTNCDFFELEISSVNKELLAADFDISVDKLNEILNYSVTIGLFQVLNGNLVSETLKERLECVVVTRERRRSYRRDKLQDNGVMSTPNSNNKSLAHDKPVTNSNNKSLAHDVTVTNAQSKVKESKLKKSKLKNIERRDNKLSMPFIKNGPKEEDEKTKNIPAKKIDNIDYQSIVDLYHKHCTSMSRVFRLSNERKAKIRIRYHTDMKDSLETLETVFKKAGESKFLQGDNPRGWKATFDWLFANSENWLKVYEGNYDNGEQKSDRNRSSGCPQKVQNESSEESAKSVLHSTI